MGILEIVKLVAVSIVALLIVAAPAVPRADAQTVRTVAVVDFIDETADGLLIGATRLSEELARLLVERSGGRLRVVPAETVRRTLRERGLVPQDLLGPNRSAEIAAAVGAEWIITARWLHLDTDIERLPDVPGIPVPRVSATSSALLELRVLDASTRRPVLSDYFGGSSPGASPFWLRRAAVEALWRAAVRIAGL